MPTSLLGVTVPDYPNTDQEACHLFTGNWIIHRINPNVGYRLLHREPSYQFIIRILQEHNFTLQVGGQIQPGDIILIDHINNYIGHSMVAINNNVWFGVNNLGTFGLLFQNSGIAVDTLCERREIAFSEFPVNPLDIQGQTIAKGDGSLLHYEIWR